MTNSETSQTGLDVTAVALELFKERSSQGGISPRQLAIECFRDATIFTDVAEDVATSGIDLITEDSNPLDVAFAPNLKKTHPINLMSRTWGDVNRVEQALADLDANPGAEQYEPYGWGKPEVNQARALFPAVVDRAKQFATAK
jgi:hypothetical protein